MKVWDEMESDRHRDAAVAIHVMGGKGPVFTVYKWADRKKRERPILSVSGEPKDHWKKNMGSWDGWDSVVNESGEKVSGYTKFPHYTTNAVAEASVLAVVKKWNDSRQWRFIQAMAELLRVRDTDFTTFGTMHLVLLGNGDAPGLCVGMISRAAYETLRQEAGQ